LFSFKLSIGKTAIVCNPLYTNEAIAGILSKNNDLLNNKYLYYYLTINDFSKLGSGILGNGSLNKKSLEQIKIPIPSLERQQETVKYLDFIYEKANKTSNEKIAELKKLNEFCLSNQKIFGENIVKTIGEVCKVNQGTYIKPDMKIQGEYPVYGGGNVSYYINQYNREDEIIVAKDGVSADCVRYEKNKFFLNHHGWTLICKEQIIKKYMFYYLQLIQPELLSIAKGTAQLGINQENFYKLKIPIPSLERQKEIVEYCEYNDTLIKQLEKEIENNKKQGQQFITVIVKAQVQTEEHDDTSSVNTEPIDEVQNEIVSVEEEEEEEEEVIVKPKPKVKKVPAV
jgi:type I restriction enzyme S subunit